MDNKKMGVPKNVEIEKLKEIQRRDLECLINTANERDHYKKSSLKLIELLSDIYWHLKRWPRIFQSKWMREFIVQAEQVIADTQEWSPDQKKSDKKK